MSIMLRLDQPSHTFKYAPGKKFPRLCDRDGIINTGSILRIEEPVLGHYDWWDVVAIPLEGDGETVLILFDELSEKNQKDVKTFFPRCELIATKH
ncbi:MAG: hypothetical protein WAX80_01805 [Minisyncoccia bacterium]